MYTLGVDTGGSKTRCIVVDESLSLLGIGDGGPGNYRVAGPDRARENVEEAMRDALATAEVDPTDEIIGGFGMGTLDTDEDYEIISGFLKEIDVVDEYHITNDVAVAYYSFTAGEPGVVVIAGTGAMAFGRNGAGEEARSSGWGWLFGDEGSGFDAARGGLQAAAKAYDGRGEPTGLVAAASEHFDLDSFDDVFTKVYGEIDHAKDIASFAKPVAETAADGDDVAMDIVRDAGSELATAASAVIEQLNLSPSPTVACQGSFGTAEVVSTQFESNLTDAYPETEFVDTVDNPVVGSIAYVAEERGDEVTRDELYELDAAITEMTASRD